MEKTPFLGAENELQKIYSNLGVVVPVGDLSQGKAPAIQPLPSVTTQDSITFNFNVMSGADITQISYNVDSLSDPDYNEAGDLTLKKGVTTLTLTDLDHNSGPYVCEFFAANANGQTHIQVTEALQPYTDWATENEVLEGNKFIGEDGQEAVGIYVPEGGLDNQAVLEYSQGNFPYYYDADNQQEKNFLWKCTAVCDIPQDAGSLWLGGFNVYFNYVEGDYDATDQGGLMYFESTDTIVGDKLVITGYGRDSLESIDWCNKYSPDNNMVAELAFDPIDTEAPDAQPVYVIVPCTFSDEIYDTPECQ